MNTDETRIKTKRKPRERAAGGRNRERQRPGVLAADRGSKVGSVERVKEFPWRT
jgi:hypothetical protein